MSTDNSVSTGTFDKHAENRKAAEQGDRDAQYNLGHAYDFGDEIPKDKAEAARWYRKAAEQGHAQAQYLLGLACEYGTGVPIDLSASTRWYRMAAEQGHALAQMAYGEACQKGLGIAQDKAEAVRQYRKAAEQGDTVAQMRVARAYQEGAGVRSNLQEAAFWYRKAAGQGSAWAQEHLDELAAKAKESSLFGKLRRTGLPLSSSDLKASISGMSREKLLALGLIGGGLLGRFVLYWFLYKAMMAAGLLQGTNIVVAMWPWLCWLAVAAGLYLLWKTIQPSSAGAPVPVENLRRVYPGFSVREGDFEYQGKKLFRVNSDGKRIDLKKWHFSDKTGEFYRITGQDGDVVSFDARSYMERRGLRLQGKKTQRAHAVLLVLAALAFPFGGAVSSDGILAGAVIVGGLVIASYVSTLKNTKKSIIYYDRLIGPQPLQRAAVDLGGQQPHGQQDDDGTI